MSLESGGIIRQNISGPPQKKDKPAKKESPLSTDEAALLGGLTARESLEEIRDKEHEEFIDTAINGNGTEQKAQEQIDREELAELEGQMAKRKEWESRINGRIAQLQERDRKEAELEERQWEYLQHMMEVFGDNYLDALDKNFQLFYQEHKDDKKQEKAIEEYDLLAGRIHSAVVLFRRDFENMFSDKTNFGSLQVLLAQAELVEELYGKIKEIDEDSPSVEGIGVPSRPNVVFVKKGLLRGAGRFLGDILKSRDKKKNQPERIEFKEEFIITIGGYESSSQLWQALDDKGFEISKTADNMLNKLSFSKEKKSLNLLVFSVSDMGFLSGATLQEIYQKASDLGLHLCPQEAGPYFRLQYQNQPRGEKIRMSMDPIEISHFELRVFFLRCDFSSGSMHLTSDLKNQNQYFYGNELFAFVRSGA